ncbi:DNA-binding protein D-ETS-4 isoform X1 [Drosophila pseudoobscura]|uniref:DNA-binding protein D-ETS-4 isoform X1 n=2 Tax=Drosophila pseudoobscura pseudoobscura TaxID=46245 RepID=A0A6I8V278_DROPS|nr:DNA-binding protein D-ETS-4 isoform X1 [Drosophila pseudoobscura]
MEYEKMMYLANSSEMPHSPHLKPQPFQALTPPDQYSAYADNFDLSLLPQDAGIPTTVYQYNAPQIKIECAWDCPTDNQQQQQQQPALAYASSGHQLIPPPAYPHSVYPSPQSSPLQSEFASFGGGYGKFHGSYDCLSSPSPSLDASSIKQELHILPPSPPESNCETPSPRSSCSESIKAEPLDSDIESFIDLNALLQQQQAQPDTKPDHQLLRECLEDTTFQKKHNLRPLALESFIGGLAEVRGDFEPVISLALEHAKREADAICMELQISQDPNAWTPSQVHAWLRSTLAQFKLPPAANLELKFSEDGAALALLSEEEFVRRLPESGSTLHAQLEIWKMAYADQPNSQIQQHQQQQPGLDLWPPASYPMLNLDDYNEDSEDDEDMEVEATVTPTPTPTPTSTSTSTPAVTAATPTSTPVKRTSGGRTGGGSHIHLWQFLKELLASPQVNGTAIRWIDRTKGIFKIEDSVRVAKLWGRRKNRPAMNYDKLSRSIRQYYKKGIMKKTERSQRLVYQFCHPYNQ